LAAANFVHLASGHDAKKVRWPDVLLGGDAQGEGSAGYDIPVGVGLVAQRHRNTGRPQAIWAFQSPHFG